jgi:hypothetical protein
MQVDTHSFLESGLDEMDFELICYIQCDHLTWCDAEQMVPERRQCK